MLCAYACSPDRGSEESVGWDTALQLANRGHEVVVLTRSSEKALSEDKFRDLNVEHRPTFESCDLPGPVQSFFSKIGKIGVDFGYLTWLLKARGVALRLHVGHSFTSSQHVTYARYWMPSPLSALPIPFVWGPVGGGESVPSAFNDVFSFKGSLFEVVRNVMRRMGEFSLLTRKNALTSHIALANTPETASRMKKMGADNVQIMNAAALSSSDLEYLAGPTNRSQQVTFASIGRLLEWKGFQLGLEAFARAELSDAKYLIVGSGSFKKRLVRLASDLGINEQVEFIEQIPRKDMFSLMKTSHALVHPSLHESGGYVCLEMMAAGNPVLCLDTGGPSLFVDSTCGFVAPIDSKENAIAFLAHGMTLIASDSTLCDKLGAVGRQRVTEFFSMTVKSDELSRIHRGLV
ncbi:MAG: glycosyltransferase family 4 protein [Bacteroidetes bacterium]|nr:glycosyltransferase family 4 protein [Bacteroidota bacterium]